MTTASTQGQEALQLIRTKVDLVAMVTAIALSVIGVIFLIVSYQGTGKEAWQQILREIAGFLIVSGTVSIFLEIRVKRAFLDEVLSKVGLAKEIQLAGIAAYKADFRQVDWDELFKSVKELDIFYSYSSTWRHNHLERLKAAARRGVRIRIVLPNPNDYITLADMARRFNQSETQMKHNILTAEEEFRAIDTGEGEVTVRFVTKSPLFSMYRFDQRVVFALYSHRHDRPPVPTFICNEGGSLFDFLQRDFSDMWHNSLPAESI